MRQRDYDRIERKRDQVLGAAKRGTPARRSYGTAEDDLPLPSENPEFDLFDPRFQKAVDAKFQAGIALRGQRHVEAVKAYEQARARRKIEAAHAATTRAETLDRARRRVRS